MAKDLSTFIYNPHRYGISHPDRDPSGYYAQLVWKLAEIHYEKPVLYRQLLEGPDSLSTRHESSELVALLQNGKLDFAFLYRSTALQNNLNLLQLPRQISLSDSSSEHLYAQVFLEVTGNPPGSRYEVIGSPIHYGIGLVNPANSWARRFLDFLLSPEAQQLYRELGFQSIPITEFLPRESSL